MIEYHEQAMTLDQRAQDVGVRHFALEADNKQLAQDVFALFQAFQLERLGHGFYRWAHTLTQIPMGSLHRYVQVGRALLEGYDPNASLTDLAAAGYARESGATRQEVTEAQQTGTVRDLAESKANAGLVRVQLPLAAKAQLEAITEGVARGLDVPEPEAFGLVVEFAAEHHEQFGAWLRERGQ